MLRSRQVFLSALVICGAAFLVGTHTSEAQEEAGYLLTVSSAGAVDFELSVAARGKRSEVLFFRESAPFSLELDSTTVFATVRATSPGELRMVLARKADGLPLTEVSGRGGVLAENLPGTGHRFAMDLSAGSQ